MEGSNPIWMHAYENDWFKNDESYSHTSERDSLDENALNNEETMNKANTNERTLDKPYYIQPRVSSISRYLIILFEDHIHLRINHSSNIYFSIESVSDIQNELNRESPNFRIPNTIVNPLGKKIETTEL